MLIGAARHIVEDCLSLSHTHAEETARFSAPPSSLLFS